MDEEEKKIEEEKKDDNLDGTLTSNENIESENEKVELNSDPKPIAQDENGQDCDVDEPSEDSTPIDTSNAIIENKAPSMTDEQQAVEKMLSQSQVNEIVGRTRTETRDSTLKSFYDRYGVNNDSEMDSLVGNGQRYDMLKEEYEGSKKDSDARISDLESKLQGVSEELALYRSGINPDRYEDAKYILKGKGLDITAENIKNELATHPEWSKVEKPLDKLVQEGADLFKKVEPEPEQHGVEQPQVSRISKLGNDKAPTHNSSSEYDAVKDLYGL